MTPLTLNHLAYLCLPFTWAGLLVLVAVITRKTTAFQRHILRSPVIWLPAVAMLSEFAFYALGLATVAAAPMVYLMTLFLASLSGLRLSRHPLAPEGAARGYRRRLAFALGLLSVLVILLQSCYPLHGADLQLLVALVAACSIPVPAFCLLAASEDLEQSALDALNVMRGGR